MKKLLLLFAVAAFFASCVRNDAESPFTESRLPVSTDESAVPLEEAVSNLYAAMKVLYPETRAGSRQIAGVELLRASDIAPAATRSGGDPLPEELVYIVNFENCEGFAVLGAHRTMEPIYCITEGGSLGVDDFRRVMNNTQTRSSGEPTLEDLWIEEEGDYLIGSSDPDFVIGQLADMIAFGILRPDPPIYEPDPIYTYVTEYTGWEMLSPTGPLLSTHWHQNSPFNMYCPANSDRVPFKAGCVPVAVAQILAYNEKPSYPVAGSVPWRLLKPYDFDIPDIDTVLQSQMYTGIAHVMREVGRGCKANYNYWWTGNTFSTPERAKNYMKNIGYSDAKKINDVDLSKVLNMLSNDCPVFVAAIGKISDAHAWVIDGCVSQQRYIITRCVQTREIIKQGREVRTLVHCNYGWKRGRANGYYLCKSFNTKNGAIAIDEELDPDWSTDYATFDWSVNKHYRMITYSK